MKKLITLILALCCALSLTAAHASALPEGMLLTRKNEHVWGSMPLPDGGILVTGYIWDIQPFKGPSPEVPSGHRWSPEEGDTVPIFATAYDATGRPLWTNTQIKTDGWHLLHAMGVLPGGNLLMASNIMMYPDMYPYALDPAKGKTQPLPENFPDYNT